MSSNSNGQPPPEDYSSTASAAINSERILRSGILKSHSPFDSSFDSDNDAESNLADQQRRLNSNSPPPKCAICLCRCHNKCFTDSCLHQFCFTCLLEWSKVSFLRILSTVLFFCPLLFSGAVRSFSGLNNAFESFSTLPSHSAYCSR